MSDDVRRDLEAAGERPVPEPRAGVADALEERLLTVARTPTPADPSPSRRGWPTRGLVTGLATLVVVLGLVVGSDILDRPSVAFELSDPVNVEVVLLDGTTLVDPEGLVLPDAAIVRIGVGGSARIGDVLLGAGDVATVEDSGLRIDRSPRAGVSQSTPSKTPATRTETPTPSPKPTDPVRPTASASASPTSRPDGSGSPKPTPTRTSEPATKTASPETQPPSKPPVDVRPLKLSAKAVGPSEVGALWTGTPGARRYILVASSSRDGAAADPVYPGSAIIGTFTRPPDKPLFFRIRSGVVELRLLVVALNADGAEISRSNVATVSLPS